LSLWVSSSFCTFFDLFLHYLLKNNNMCGWGALLLLLCMQQQGRGNKKLLGLMDTPGKPGVKGEDQGTAPNNQDCLLAATLPSLDVDGFQRMMIACMLA
jgi:hypothetical protein